MKGIGIRKEIIEFLSSNVHNDQKEPNFDEERLKSDPQPTLFLNLPSQLPLHIQNSDQNDNLGVRGPEKNSRSQKNRICSRKSMVRVRNNFNKRDTHLVYFWRYKYQG